MKDKKLSFAAFVWQALALIFVLVCMAFIFLYPKEAAAGVTNGLISCYKNIIPSLFPFFIVSNFLLKSGVAPALGAVLRPYTRALGIKNKDAPTAVMLGSLGGFAVGGSAVGELYEKGAVTKSQAELLLCAVINSGPAFIVNTVGFAMLGSAGAGFLLLGALLSATLLTGIVISHFMRGVRKGAEVSASIVQTQSEPQSFAALFVQSVSGAVRSTVTVCSYVIFFAFLCAGFSVLPLNARLTYALSAILEVTAGCAAGSQMPYGIYLCAASLSLLGLSVVFQLRALLPKNISLAPLLLSRVVHLPLTLILLKFFISRFPQAVASAASPIFTTAHRMPADAALVALVFCVLFVCEISPEALFTRKNK